MAETVTKRMTTAEFIDWAMAQPKGRYELVNGQVVAMAPERARHNLAKLNAAAALRTVFRKSGKDCTVFTDGMSVIVDEHTTYEPDCLVQCGSSIDLDTVTADAPMVIVEVISPSSQNMDNVAKLADYFRLPSVVHYLVIDPVRRLVIHHRRTNDKRIETVALEDGLLELAPPGVSVPIESFFEDLDAA